MKLKLIGLSLLCLSVLVSGISVVYSKHLQRRYFVELQEVEKMRDELGIRWEQLQLEESTWSNQARIERLAREKLKMSTVRHSEIVMLELPQP